MSVGSGADKAFSMTAKESTNLLMLTLLLVAGFYLCTQAGKDYFLPHSRALYSLVEKDLSQLSKNAEELNRIGSVEIEAAENDDTAAIWISELRSVIPVTKGGDLHVEVLVISQLEEENKQAVVQMTFSNQASGNFQKEIARTYTLE